VESGAPIVESSAAEAVSAPAAASHSRRSAPCCPICSRKSGLVPANAVAKRLGMSLRAFERMYRIYFSDRRPVKFRRRGVMRLIPEDEVDLFVSDGAEAVIDYRRRKGRLTEEEERLLTDGLDPAGRNLPQRVFPSHGGT
jgi:hypothetical protein